ncbi:hypothetical protein GDO78_007753 [Eleutherodactylus coqui]|uniref:Uncharacterized protein n=1 Tax=Eleutherodactylus coqui TaxID=57060 RepID=A0A8J6FI55_ELECQ|nr:hypothetical protein GDO78_007753 [Eleutherodactylus coqui]
MVIVIMENRMAVYNFVTFHYLFYNLHRKTSLWVLLWQNQQWYRVELLMTTWKLSEVLACMSIRSTAGIHISILYFRFSRPVHRSVLSGWGVLITGSDVIFTVSLFYSPEYLEAIVN